MMHPQLYAMYRFNSHKTRGFTYVELLISVTITALLVAGLMGVVHTATGVHDDVSQRNELAREARFAMQRMLRTISHSPKLLLPFNDNPNTNWPEHIREQTIPASPPVGDSTFATAVLAVTLPADIDLDDDGFPDADNDEDGRIDEDLAGDKFFNNAPGIIGIDDNGDGSVDNSNAVKPFDDNDEDHVDTEDSIDQLDNDGDGNIDEDPRPDMNSDGEPGIAGVDDNGDGSIDNTHANDDDEDGSQDEDWLDPVVYYLDGNELKERLPMPWDVNFDFQVTGQDFMVSTLSGNVTRFRVERIEASTGGQLVDLILELTHPTSGELVRLQTRVRVGGAL